ncbi:hypothetical protein ASG72_18125 [Bosea sp. Leaf344]|nr:hypothetical protein ASG72_18125 [Bosea sp. Leaf344]
MQITAPLADPSQFGQLRKSIHNAFCYRRRQCRWWSRVGIWGWWNGIGLRGLVELGSITATEFVSALQRQGAFRLLPIATETVRAEVYAAAMSVPASIRADGTGRYQPFKIAIEPVIVTTRSLPIPDSIGMMPMLLPD